MSTPQRRYILHIDDDQDDQLMLQEAIKEIDPSLSIRKAGNGQEGLELLMQCMLLSDLPSLIVLDLNMPGMDGKQVLKEIRKEKTLSTIPIILFTTSSSQMDKLFANKENVELITKPPTQSGFTSSIRIVLGHINKMKEV